MDTITIIATAVSFLLTLGVCAFYWAKVKKVAEEMKGLLSVIVEAFSDNEITADELKTIMAESKDVITAVKDIFTKYKKDQK